jgi:pilus assembly protein Flp/PilA
MEPTSEYFDMFTASYVFAHTGAMGRRVHATFSNLKGDKRGVTAMEYGILAGLVAVVIIAGVTQVGVNLNALFNGIAQKLAVVG